MGRPSEDAPFFVTSHPTADPPRAEVAGAGLIVLAAVCFATLGPLTRFAEEAGVPALALVTWRAGLGALVMVAFIAARAAAGMARPKPLSEIPTRDRRFILAAAVANALLNLSVFLAFTRVSIALALLVFYLYPAMVALASAAWFGEKLDRLRWLALALSLAGLVLVLTGGEGIGQVDALGVALAFAGAVAQVFYVLAARHGFAHVPGAQAAGFTMGGACLLYLGAGAITGTFATLSTPLASLDALWPVAVAGILGAGVPTVAYITGIRRLGPPRAAILATLEPVVAVALAAWLLGEIPLPVQIVGGVLIVVAAVVLQLGPVPASDHEAVAA